MFGPDLRIYSLITVGGVIGSLLRWLVAVLVPLTAGGLPWPTFIANAMGCFVIGLVSTGTTSNGFHPLGPRARLFIMTGICGGYTTFSAFSGEELRFLLAGDLRRAVIYLALSLASWLAAVWLGDTIARRLNMAR
ncbi:MAG TPA: fluoride efflux transporter CrcB [Reyranella sp.]|nr:fluoride efflux transporter CrcB [Reyranella sp.]